MLLNLHGDLCYEAAHGVIPGKGVSLPLWFGLRESERYMMVVTERREDRRNIVEPSHEKNV